MAIEGHKEGGEKIGLNNAAAGVDIETHEQRCDCQ